MLKHSGVRSGGAAMVINPGNTVPISAPPITKVVTNFRALSGLDLLHVRNSSLSGQPSDKYPQICSIELFRGVSISAQPQKSRCIAVRSGRRVSR